MRVIIIDDNQTNLILFRHLLKQVSGIGTVVCFDKAAEALLWTKENEPDLVLLDYLMPGMNGLEFLTQFRAIENYQDIPVIIITADTENNVRQKGLNLGAHDFLNKPIDKMEFIARVRNLLVLRKSQLALTDKAKWLAIEVRRATADLKVREKEMVLRLSKAAEHRDPETGQHLIRMANYSKLIAKKLGLCEEEQELILEAAPMHDIGKVGTPDAILLKQGKLTEAEFVIMKQHAQAGYDILSGSDSLLIRTAAALALSHHEKFDGSGYPNALKGDDIPLHGRIVAVADVFDALTSSRPYKKPWTLDAASEFLRDQTGSHFDPECVKAFFAAWEDVLEIHARYKDENDFLDVEQL
jgi:putative two-component system response regulator